MSSNFNNAKIINVYYTKGDRKPYDVNGKPIAYIGEEYIGANEATELRFHFGEELDSASAIIVAKRANGDTRLDPLELVGTGVNSYFKVTLNAWYAEYKGKMTIIFKVYNGTVTYDDPETPTQIVSTTGQIIVSDIFNLEVAYAPNASSLVPPFETEDYDDWFFTLSTKLDKAQSITVTGALPTLTGGVYNDRYFYVEDEGVGRLYYIDGSTAIECVWGIGQVNFATTNVPSSALTAGQMRYNDTTGSLDLGLKGNHTLKIGEVLEKRVRNDEAVSLKVGQVVYVSGSVGNSGLLLIKKASNLGEATSSKTFGMVATAMNTTSSKDGYVYVYGLLQGIDLTDADISESVFSSGDVGAGLWLGENGKITKTLPTADNKHSVFVGYLDSYNGAGSNCSIYVKIQNGYELNELHNVRIATLANNDVLRYNATRGVWVNSTTLTTAEANITDLQGRMTTEEANVDNLQSRMTTAEADIENIEDGTTIVGKAYEDENGDNIPSTYLKQVNASATYIPLSQKGANNGVVPLNSNGKISSQYLSGEQDDYIEFADLASFPLVGEADIIYCAIDTGLIYRWTGSTYAVISPSLALGTTSTTAYRGDLGLALETLTNNIVDGDQALSLKDQVITNTAVGTNPLVVNAIASTTADLAQFKINNSNRLRVDSSGYIANIGLYNITAATNALILAETTGTTIRRSVNDTNPALIVNKNLGTGNILQLQSAGANKLEFDVNGNTFKNGNIFLHNTGSGNLGVGDRANRFGGTSSTGVGHLALFSANATGNTSVGHASLFDATGGGNTAIGESAGRTITTGANNTFVGNTAGYSGSQLVSAVNSTAIGNGSFTDKSNQMVFGNASVSEILLSRKVDGIKVGIGTTTPALVGFGNELTLSGSGFSGQQVAILNLQGTTLVDGNIGALSFFNSTTRIGNIAGARSGADNSGRLVFSTATTATLTEKMTILPNGNVGIGTTSPTDTLQVNGAINIGSNRIYNGASADSAGLFISSNQLNLSGFSGIILRSSNAGTQSQTERMRITDTGNVGIGTSSPAEALHIISNTANQGIRIERTSSTTGAYSLAIKSNGHFEIAESGVSTRMIIHKTTGLVGIGELTPTAQLQVKSESTTRVPLIVDTLASQTANLAEFKSNGTNRVIFYENGIIGASALRNTNLAVQAFIDLLSTGVQIARNIADTNPALIVNLANSSATGNIEVWQFAGSAVANVNRFGSFRGLSLDNLSSSNNSRVFMGDTGTTISRNINDANVTLKVQQSNVSASGRLQEWLYGSDVVSSVEKDGIANFTGTPSNEQTGDYTLVLADKGKVLRVNSSSNRTITIPLNSSVAFPIDTELAILRYGTGTVSISPTSGVTLNSKNSERKISGQYGSVALKKIGTDEWVLVGSLEA